MTIKKNTIREDESDIINFQPSRTNAFTQNLLLFGASILLAQCLTGASPIWSGLPVLYIFWKYLQDFKHQKYILTTQRLKIETGVIFTKKNEVELYRISDYSLKRGLLYKLIDLCLISLKYQPFLIEDILLTTSDPDNPSIQLNGISNAAKIKEKIRSAVNDDPRGRIVIRR